MAGLDPAIHLKRVLRRWMDARVKPAHDEGWFSYDPGSAAHHAAKSGALRSIRGTLNTKKNPAVRTAGLLF
jgi:hypothetical protein